MINCISVSVYRDNSDPGVDQVDRDRSGGLPGIELEERRDYVRVREKWVLSQRNTVIS